MEAVGRSVARWMVVSVLAASALAGCGGGSASSNGAATSNGSGNPDGGASNGGSGKTAVGATSLWTDLPVAEIALIGGAASSAEGTAQAGGSARLISAGGIALDSSLSPPQAPAIPSAPTGAMSLSGSALNADVSAPGAVAISGTVQSAGSDGVRHITAAGDVMISGTLRAADLGTNRQGFDIEAPGHTVYVSGTVDSSGGSGQGGGPLTIVADQVVVTGHLSTAGGAGAQPGAAGAITINTTAAAWLTGTLDASGGDADGGDGATGARAGDVTIAGGGDVAVTGSVRVRGGAGASSAANAQGGAAAALAVDCAGTLTWQAMLDARGGGAMAKGAGGTVAGGAAGTFTVGANTAPKAISVLVPMALTGGSGNAVGGDGGSAELDAKGGDLVIASALDVSGGDSAGNPGKGGTILGAPGPANAMANLNISGKLLANGGSVPKGTAMGGSAKGGDGGLIKLVQQALTGSATALSTAAIQANGGQSGGTGVAGGGGVIYVFTNDGDNTVHGQLQVRGGQAPDSGGTGGGGGLVYIFSGNGHDFTSGVLTIAPDGVIDASGGDGTIGGSARNNGAGGVNTFPSSQSDEFDVEQIAVLINSDGVHGSDRGWIENQGKVIARGGKANGRGGDVVYHGKQQNGNETPVPGDVENTSDGTGTNGDFAGE